MKPLTAFLCIMVTLSLAFSIAAFALVANNGMLSSNSPTKSQTPTTYPTNPPITSNPPPSITIAPTNNPNPKIINPQGPITAQLNIEPNDNIPASGCYLLITGTVTNNSPNTVSNVGLKVYCSATVFASYQTVIDVTVPISSGNYSTATTYTLSTMAPYQSIDIFIKIHPGYQSQEPNLHGANVTLVWSNTP